MIIISRIKSYEENPPFNLTLFRVSTETQIELLLSKKKNEMKNIMPAEIPVLCQKI